MFLRNYYNMQAIKTLAEFYPLYTEAITSFPDIFSAFEAGKISLKRVNGTVDNTVVSYATPLVPKTYIGEYSTTTPGRTTAGTCIAFGSGDTAVTFDDYKLEAPFANGVIGALTSASNVNYVTATYDADTDTLAVTVNVSVTNKSSADVTIREFGLCAYYYYYYREVLTTPLTIEAGTTKTFQYTINCSIPEAS